MRLRMELFVDDLDVSAAFYADVLEFEVTRREEFYASLRRGDVTLGLGRADGLSAHDKTGPGRVWRSPDAGGAAALDHRRGAGVEIVLELAGPEEVAALHDRCRVRQLAIEPLREQPWGLRDFRLFDPDGYYLRITHAAA
ncbi:VOC family protein [Paractinoplanes lichenicola]|uniref:VOC family protein n=1 Tax=Paractinoplanes lichenicola TaxID=2802976 RepID=A0ABS1VYG4_9ACTN|nr:VOC family protein [Actinoplanes lichenicola]MBL7259532.1 VOC family protein [Actinoplanes lichenicola]